MPPAAHCSEVLDRSVDGVGHPGDSPAPFLQLSEPLLLENQPLGRLPYPQNCRLDLNVLTRQPPTEALGEPRHATTLLLDSSRPVGSKRAHDPLALRPPRPQAGHRRSAAVTRVGPGRRPGPTRTALPSPNSTSGGGAIHVEDTEGAASRRRAQAPAPAATVGLHHRGLGGRRHRHRDEGWRWDRDHGRCLRGCWTAYADRLTRPGKVQPLRPTSVSGTSARSATAAFGRRPADLPGHVAALIAADLRRGASGYAPTARGSAGTSQIYRRARLPRTRAEEPRRPAGRPAPISRPVP